MGIIYGFEDKDWVDMYKLFVHIKERKPKNLLEIRDFWWGLPKRTPEDCCAMFLQLAAAEDVDTSKCYDLLDKIHDMYSQLRK